MEIGEKIDSTFLTLTDFRRGWGNYASTGTSVTGCRRAVGLLPGFLLPYSLKSPSPAWWQTTPLAIPGIGPVTATALIAAIGNGGAFHRGREFAA